MFTIFLVDDDSRVLKALARLLRAKGYEVGEVDGKLGLATRASIKKVQEKLGLPADSYPSPELIARLRSR